MIPGQLIKDQGARSMQDVVKNSPGVTFNMGDGQRDQFVIRGFDASGDMYIDGMRDDALYYRDLSNVERVEVIKGPAAVLYGRGSSGGLINRITKKPGEKISEFRLTSGSYKQRRGEFDIGDKLSESASFRITGAVEDSGSFRSQGFLERQSIAPSLKLQFSENTDLLLQVEKLHDKRITDFGIPAFNGRPLSINPKTYYGSRNARDDDYSDADVLNTRAVFTHKFNDNFTLRNMFGTYNYDLDRTQTLVSKVNSAARTVTMNHSETYRQDDGWFNQLELLQKAELGGTKHELLYGMEVGEQKKTMVRWNWTVNPNNIALFNPVLPGMSDFGARLPAFNNNQTELQTLGFYVQDMITLSDHWKALVGARHDHFVQKMNNRPLAGNANPADFERTDNTWSRRAGLVYQPNDWQSYYVSWSKSYQPSGETLNFSQDQNQMKPEETNNIEVGTKTDFFNGKLSTTASIYHLERENMKGVDIVSNKLIGVGKQRTRGIELTATGEIAPRWQIFAGYAYMDAEITDSVAAHNGVALQGNRAALTPRNSANLWLMHQLNDGWSVGGGVNYMGDQYTGPDNTVTLHSFMTADAMAVYRSKRYDLAFNLKNLTDKRYYASAHTSNPNVNAPGAPRRAEVTLTMRF